MIWIYLFLITLFIRPQDWPGNPVYGMPVNDIIIVGGILTGLLGTKKNREILTIPMTYLLCIFVCLAFLTNLFNGNIDAGVEQFIELFKRLCVYFMVILHINSYKKINNVLLLSILLGCVLAFQGIYQNNNGVGWAMQSLHSGNSLIKQEDIYEFQKYGARTFWIGLWDGPNVLAIAYLFGICYAFDGIFKKNNSFILKVINVILFSLLITGIYLTKSRGGFLALIISCFLFGIFRFNWKKVVLISIIIIPIIFSFTPSRMKVLNSEENSAHERTWLWERGYYMFLNQPITGIGKGQFGNKLELISHNNYVTNMAEMGFPGLLIYIALFYWPIKNFYRILMDKNNSNNSEAIMFSRILLVTLVGFAVATFFVVMEHDILYALCALSAGTIMIAKGKSKEITLKLKDWGAISILSILMIVLVWLVSVKEIF